MIMKKEIKGLEWSRTFHIVTKHQKLPQDMDWACNVTDFPQIFDKNYYSSKIIIINFVIIILVLVHAI